MEAVDEGLLCCRYVRRTKAAPQLMPDTIPPEGWSARLAAIPPLGATGPRRGWGPLILHRPKQLAYDSVDYNVITWQCNYSVITWHDLGCYLLKYNSPHNKYIQYTWIIQTYIFLIFHVKFKVESYFLCKSFTLEPPSILWYLKPNSGGSSFCHCFTCKIFNVHNP